MSKRRSDSDDMADHNESTRSSRSKIMNVSSSTNTTIDLHIDPSISTIISILQLINECTGKHEESTQLHEQAYKLSLQYPDSFTNNILKYNNQIIEISILDNIRLHYNLNFPFLREPNSISIQSNTFSENITNYKCFKKIILKNAKVVPILESVQFSRDLETKKIRFRSDCYIECCNGFQINSYLNDEILESSNILFNMLNVWYISYMLLLNDGGLTSDLKHQLIHKIWRNFMTCFSALENVEIAVNVDSENNVRIANILHCYYTR